MEKSEEEYSRITQAIDDVRVDAVETQDELYRKNYQPFDVIPYFRKTGWEFSFHNWKTNQPWILISSMRHPATGHPIPDFWGDFSEMSQGTQGKGDFVFLKRKDLMRPCYAWLELRRKQVRTLGTSPRRSRGDLLEKLKPLGNDEEKGEEKSEKPEKSLDTQ